MGKKRDAIFDEVQINEIKAIVGQVVLSVGTKLRYTEVPAMEDGRDIPSWENIQSMGSGLLATEFDGGDLLGSEEMGFYLPYTLTENEVTVVMLIKYDDRPNEILFPQYSAVDEAITGFTNKDNVTLIKVWATG